MKKILLLTVLGYLFISMALSSSDSQLAKESYEVRI